MSAIYDSALGRSVRGNPQGDRSRIGRGTVAAPILTATVRCSASLAAAAQARRILELGTALGYTALSFASGAPNAIVDTVERDPDHVRLARDHIAAAALDHRITVHEATSPAVVQTLDPGYDVAFFDGGTPVPALHKTLRDLLRTGGDADHRQPQSRRHGRRGTQSAVRRQILAQRARRRRRRDRNERQAVRPAVAASTTP